MKYNKPPYPSAYWKLQIRQLGKFFFIFPAYVVTLIACFYSEFKMNQALFVTGNVSRQSDSNLLILESVNIAIEYEPDVLKPFIASILFGWTFVMTYIYMLYQFAPLIYYTVCLLRDEHKWSRKMRVFLEDLQENAYEEHRMLTEKEQKKIERFEKRPRMFSFGMFCQCCFYVWLFASICDMVDIKFIRLDGSEVESKSRSNCPNPQRNQ
ncbi:hypothetical protein M3Y97_01059500 [Aphelenchoides bicaudatus]|nr:hypothetical protein M3Y97_01059500 [Aphelenchoides bicaudatus]